jgi:peptidyl-prolyl cis-trans isomerase C
MTRNSLTALALAAALPLVGQQAPAPQTPAPSAAKPAQAAASGDAIVAQINGETITRAKLDQLWERAGTRARTQYEKSGGGKMGFLDNYIKKRLLLQEAYKRSFQEQPHVKAELEAARESALFDLYVRDVIGSTIVTEEQIRKFYEENLPDFAVPARAKVRHILVTTQDRSAAEARAKLAQVMTELAPYQVAAAKDAQGAKEILASRFSEAAKKYSEDTTAPNGGDLGWKTRDGLDEKFAEVVFSMNVGVMSGIIESSFGYHLVLVEARQEEDVEPYETARLSIREYLMTRDASKVVEQVSKLSNELHRTSKVAVFPENVR